jgi:Flp pilus assembly protein TadD
MLPDPTVNEGSPEAGGSSARPAPGSSKPAAKAAWWRGLLLAAAVLLAYGPVWHAGFIWDDDKYVTDNSLLTAPDGLKRIWFSLDSPSQYFPLTYTMLRTERAFWGLNATGYHLVNILLQALNALLVWRLLLRLRVPGAWLGAALFALHPVQVESVAWITEQKNLLSLLFSLLAALAWLEFIEAEPAASRRFYALSLVSFALALCSKTTACTLPFALLLILWLKRVPIRWPRLLQIVPFFLLSLGMGLLTMWWERYHQGTEGKPFALGALERVLIASRAIWFYAGKLLWPTNLTFSYPRWTISPADPLSYVWLAALVALGAAVVFARRRPGRGPETAILFYAVTLSPLLGFIMLYTFRYTFVADHYQYVASIGPLALAAAGIDLAFERVRKPQPILKAALCGGLLLTLGAATWNQCRMYADAETLWRATIARNPASALAHNSLGVLLLERGELDQAETEFERTVKIQADNPEPLNNLGAIRLRQGRLEDALAFFRRAVKVKPDYAGSYYNLGIVLAQLGRLNEAITNFQKTLELYPPYVEAQEHWGSALYQQGRFAEALTHYRAAMELQPGNPYLLSHVAWIRATCPEASVRDGPEALAFARQANEIAEGQDPTILEALGAAYAEAGQFQEAAAAVRQALDLPAAQQDAQQRAMLKHQLDLYAGHTPYRSGGD